MLFCEPVLWQLFMFLKHACEIVLKKAYVMLHSVSRTLWTVESRLCWLCCSPQLLSPLPGKTLPKAKSGHTKDTVGNNVPWRANNLQACTPFLMEEESVLYGVVFGWKRNLHTVSPPLHMVACPCWAVSQSLCSSFNYDVLSLSVSFFTTVTQTQ